MSSLVNTNYQQIRGFNYIPSYAYILNDIMDHFEEGVWDREFGYAKMLNANSLRIWVSSVSFHRDIPLFLERFTKILDIAEKYNLTIMPVLYNRWSNLDFPFGQLNYFDVIASKQPRLEHKKYIKEFVSFFRHDRRIIMWDMCNEPFLYLWESVGIDDIQLVDLLNKKEIGFWELMVSYFREADASQPLTFGTGFPVDNKLSKVYELEDVVSCHPYSGWWDNGYEEEVQGYIELANRLGKPLVCSETCQGSLDDAIRSECVEKSLHTLKSHNIGWYAWLLCEGEIVSARRDRTDNNAKPGDRGYMSFVLKDGTIRSGHEIIKKLNDRIY